MYDKELKVAVDAVRQASMLCAQVQQILVTDETLEKKDKSPVTIADYGAQAVISHKLDMSFPEVPLVGEEDASVLRDDAGEAMREKVGAFVNQILPDLEANDWLDAIDRGASQGGATGRFWTLDPVDGTKGFIRGDQYAVALALIEDGAVVAGVLGCPNLRYNPADLSSVGTLFSAARGRGAWAHSLYDDQKKRVAVSQCGNPATARFCESVESGHTKHSASEKIAGMLGITAPSFRIDSQCKYGAVARGQAEIYLRLPTRADYEEKIWDHAAGSIVVEEAGGEITDIHGKPLDFSCGRTLKKNKGVITTNGMFHDQVLAAVQRVLL